MRIGHIRCLIMFCLVIMTMAGGCSEAAVGSSVQSKIRILFRADDIGSSHTANIACIRSYKEGVARSVEVMVPAPWFKEAAKMLRENPGYDVGVHLTLTSEWENIKWGPITKSSSLCDEYGHFYPMTSQRSDFPPNTGFLQANPDIKEVEAELRAQIELAIKEIPQVSHLSSHMGTATCTPELRELVDKLAAEYKLPLGGPGLKQAGGFGGSKTTPQEKEAALLKILENLKEGTYLFVEHPGLDTAEMRAIGHKGYEHVAADRKGVTDAFTSKKVLELIRKRGIELISYADLYKE